MKQYLTKLYKRLLDAKLRTKIFLGLALVVYLSILLFTVIHVNYEVIMPGEITPIGRYVEIDTNEKTGNVFTVSVYTKKKISLFQKWISEKNPHLDLTEFDPKEDLTDQQEIRQGEIYRDLSIDYSIIVAYREAKKVNPEVSIDYSFSGAIIIHTVNTTPEQLEIGDVITKINGVSVTEENFNTILRKEENDDTCSTKQITLTIRKYKTTKEIDIVVPESCTNETRILNVWVYPLYDIKDTNPNINKKKIRNLGPSGGLMQTLGIYNALIPNQDITKGLNITGTGTINPNGTSGAVGGVKQKVTRIYLYDFLRVITMDVFFVSSENYAEAKEIYDKIVNPRFELIKVNSFSDVLAYLEKKEAKQ